MSEYEICNYEEKALEELVSVGSKAASKWAWPYQHTIDSMRNFCTKPNFDPKLLPYCKKDGEIVGYVMTEIGSKFLGSNLPVEEEKFARILYPRFLPGHEKAMDMLLKKIIEVLSDKGIEFVRIRTSTMRPYSFRFLESMGFEEDKDTFPRGYKLYYQYKQEQGQITYDTKDVQNFNEETDLEESSKWVAEFFKNLTVEEAREHIQKVSTRADLVSHLVIRENNKLAGYCFGYPNRKVTDIHATYYIEAINEEYFKQLLVKAINNSLNAKADSFIVDLIYSISKYEEAAKKIGMEKVATWYVFEKKL